MASDMVELVARAIALASYPYAAEELLKGAQAFGDLVEENFVEAARAAIQAMREPTEAMIVAGYANFGDHNHASYGDPKPIWHPMIDDALGKP